MHVFCPFRIQKGGFQAAWTSVEESTEQHRSVPYPKRKIRLESTYIRIFFGFSAALPCENMPKTAQKTQT